MIHVKRPLGRPDRACYIQILMRIRQRLVGLALLGLLTVLWPATTKPPPLHDVFANRPTRSAMVETVTFGKSKRIEEVTVADVLRHPIWMWAVDEEAVEGQDETWTKPITSTTDVGEDIVRFYPTLAFRVVGTGLIAFGDYNHGAGGILGFLTWQDGQRVDLRDAEGLAFPVTLEAIPTILGKPGVRFRLETPDGFARRID